MDLSQDNSVGISKSMGIAQTSIAEAYNELKPDIIVDGILGTGISGEIKEPYASAINFINSTECYKFAVDVPSGLDPQTGNGIAIIITGTGDDPANHPGHSPLYRVEESVITWWLDQLDDGTVSF